VTTAKQPRFTNPTRITNQWLPLSRTPRVELRGTADGKPARTVRRLLKRTKAFRVHGRRVRAAIVQDRAYLEGKLHEVALDYYAQADDGTVYYLGEDTDIYNAAGTRVISHEGEFLYGRDTNVLGVAMPADPRRGQRFVFEDIPRVGSERSRVVSLTRKLTVPAGTFEPVLEVEARVLPDRETEQKFFARGVGLLKEQAPDGAVELISRP
jgi:hypothetical protein